MSMNPSPASAEPTTTLPTLVPSPPRVRDLAHLGDEIAELSAHLDAATARLLGLIREFDARGGWNTGFGSCAEWLAWRVGMSPGAAREHVRVASALNTLPGLAEAFARGQLSYSKVRALTVSPPRRPRRACSRWGGAGVQCTWSTSYGDGVRWTGMPRSVRPLTSTRAACSRSIGTTTARW